MFYMFQKGENSKIPINKVVDKTGEISIEIQLNINHGDNAFTLVRVSRSSYKDWGKNTSHWH